MEAKLKVVEDLVTFLNSKIEVDDDLKTMFSEFTLSLKETEEKAVKTAGKKNKKDNSASNGEKKKRKASIFNLFIQDEMVSVKANHPDVKDGKMLISLASEMWKISEYGKFIRDKSMELKKENKDASNEEIYDKVKKMYAGASSETAQPVDAAPKKGKGSKKASKKTENEDSNEE